MPPRISAGLVMYRTGTVGPPGLEVFLVHPGGPFFRNKDIGAWGIPKGEPQPGEDLPTAARREFNEETGLTPPDDPSLFVPLASVRQAGGKTVHAWAFPGDWDPTQGFHSLDFEIEWPPRSGRIQRFPEVDQVSFFDVREARVRIHPAQMPFIDRLEEALALARR